MKQRQKVYFQEDKGILFHLTMSVLPKWSLSLCPTLRENMRQGSKKGKVEWFVSLFKTKLTLISCLLYTSDAADDLLCVDLVNINSRVLVPWNDSDFTARFIKWSQLFLALFKAYRIYYKEFFIISKKYFSIKLYIFLQEGWTVNLQKYHE